MMRTTLDIADDVLAAARTLAAERRVSIGAALSDIARRGLRDQAIRRAGFLPTFGVDPGSAPITPEMVREANEDW
ncbi:MAG: antitoxin [Euzebya sp.]